MTRNTGVDTTWKDSQPTVDEALAFADLGLPASYYGISYGRALRTLAAEVRRLRGDPTTDVPADSATNGTPSPGESS